MAGSPNIAIVAQVPTDWNPQKALEGTENALQAHPDLAGIYAPWNDALQGIFSVLKQKGQLVPVGDPKHITIVSIDGTPLGCKAVRDRLIDLEIATPLPEMAKRAVTAAAKAANGQTVSPRPSSCPASPTGPTTSPRWRPRSGAAPPEPCAPGDDRPRAPAGGRRGRIGAMSTRLGGLAGERRATTRAAAARSGARAAVARLVQEAPMVPVLVATSAVFCLTVDGFTSGANLGNMARFFAPLLVASVGATFVFLLGEIDLSIGSTLSLASVLAALAMRASGSVWLGAAAGVATGLAIGAVNGAAVALLRFPAFVHTLGMLLTVRAVGMLLTGGHSVGRLPVAALAFGRGDLLGLPGLLWIAAAVYLAARSRWAGPPSAASCSWSAPTGARRPSTASASRARASSPSWSRARSPASPASWSCSASAPAARSWATTSC